jgi:protein-S-isoprenylcysteine O-methyltransferase Ste14
MPTEAQVRLYEQKVAARRQRREARRPAVLAFRNLFALIALGLVVYTVVSFWMTFQIGQDCAQSSTDFTCNSNPPMTWSNPAAIYAIVAYIAVVALILWVKNSNEHKIRTIARARRSALYEGHPWAQYRIEHPYLSHVLVVGGMLTVLNLLHGRRGK